MFKKVLVAEDYESSTISVQKALEDLGIENAHYVYYCDDALERIKMGLHEKKPYDLLITDLSFDDDYRQKDHILKSGTELTEAVKNVQPEIKIIVFSVEKKPNIIDNLFEKYKINGFVSKGREDTKQLKRAIKAVYNNEKHISLDLKKSIREKNAYEFTSFDITLISLLSNGMLQKKIPEYLKENSIKPCSLSSVEKCINNLKESLNVRNNEQLVAIFKDLGFI